jgi:hypothetical protein
VDARDVAKLLTPIAHALGYQRRKHLFWKPGHETTLLCELEDNPWGNGVYVNYGITPNPMVTKTTPPSTEYWGLGGRAASLRSPFKDSFERLATDRIDAMPTSEIEGAFRWLLGWMEEQFGDATAVRRAVLNMPEDSCTLWDAMVLVLMRDWARGELKEPSRYFGETPYYRSARPEV